MRSARRRAAGVREQTSSSAHATSSQPAPAGAARRSRPGARSCSAARGRRGGLRPARGFPGRARESRTRSWARIVGAMSVLEISPRSWVSLEVSSPRERPPRPAAPTHSSREGREEAESLCTTIISSRRSRVAGQLLQGAAPPATRRDRRHDQRPARQQPTHARASERRGPAQRDGRHAPGLVGGHGRIGAVRRPRPAYAAPPSSGGEQPRPQFARCAAGPRQRPGPARDPSAGPRGRSCRGAGGEP